MAAIYMRNVKDQLSCKLIADEHRSPFYVAVPEAVPDMNAFAQGNSYRCYIGPPPLCNKNKFEFTGLSGYTAWMTDFLATKQ